MNKIFSKIIESITFVTILLLSRFLYSKFALKSKSENLIYLSHSEKLIFIYLLINVSIKNSMLHLYPIF